MGKLRTNIKIYDYRAGTKGKVSLRVSDLLPEMGGQLFTDIIPHDTFSLHRNPNLNLNSYTNTNPDPNSNPNTAVAVSRSKGLRRNVVSLVF